MIRCREESVHGYVKRPVSVWVITHWPDAEHPIAGPYQSYAYAFAQARRLVRDRSEFVWRDHARPGDTEQLELVGIGRTTH